MRAVIQRVREARVEVGGEVVGQIDRGLLVLVGLAITDTPAELAWLADKLPNLRIFEDAAGKMNLSVLDLRTPEHGNHDAGILLVPNFTLAGDAHKGRRPSFDAAMRPEHAEPLFNALVDLVRAACPRVATGRFRTEMQVHLINDGPVTLILEAGKSHG